MGADSPTRPPPPPARIPVFHPPPNAKALPIAREEVIEPPGLEPETARVLSTLEGKLLARLEEIREELGERPSHVQIDVNRAPSTAPKERQHWVWRLLGLITAGMAGAAALVGACAALYAQLRHEPVDYSKVFKQNQEFQKAVIDKFAEQDAYNRAERDHVNDLFGALGVKIVPAPGEPPHDPIELLPAPLPDPKKKPKPPSIQPRAPAPLPPPPFNPPK